MALDDLTDVAFFMHLVDAGGVTATGKRLGASPRRHAGGVLRPFHLHGRALRRHNPRAQRLPSPLQGPTGRPAPAGGMRISSWQGQGPGPAPDQPRSQGDHGHLRPGRPGGETDAAPGPRPQRRSGLRPDGGRDVVRRHRHQPGRTRPGLPVRRPGRNRPPRTDRPRYGGLIRRGGQPVVRRASWPARQRAGQGSARRPVHWR